LVPGRFGEEHYGRLAPRENPGRKSECRADHANRAQKLPAISRIVQSYLLSKHHFPAANLGLCRSVDIQGKDRLATNVKRTIGNRHEALRASDRDRGAKGFMAISDCSLDIGRQPVLSLNVD